jgi:hypothetical protein
MGSVWLSYLIIYFMFTKFNLRKYLYVTVSLNLLVKIAAYMYYKRLKVLIFLL